MRRLFDIMGYTYNADQYGPECIIVEMTRRGGVPSHYSIVDEDAETLLDMASAVKNIDRENESSFDSDDFPKAIFRDQLSDRPGDGTEPNRCGNCGKELGEN